MDFSKGYTFYGKKIHWPNVVKCIFVCILYITASLPAFSQDEISLDNYTGLWTNDLSWTDGTNPGTNGINNNVFVNGTIKSSGDLDFNNGDLTVNDTLLIYGNLTLGNNADFTISNGGVVVVYGDYLSGNQVNTVAGGYFIVMGEFEQQGADNQGSFDLTTGSVFIFDDTPQIKTGGGYVDLSCPDPEDYPANCSFGDSTDFAADPFSEFVNSGGYVISSSGPLNIFGFSGTVDLSVSNDGDSYQWYKDGLAISGETSHTFTSTTPGEYYVEIYIGASVFESSAVNFYFHEPELWLKADAGVTESGSDVTSWLDNSPDAYSASQSSSDLMPAYISDPDDPIFNYFPYIDFDGSERLALDNYYDARDFDQIYVFTVFRTDYSGPDDFDNWAFLDYDRSEFFNAYVIGSDGTLGFSFNGSSVVDAKGSSAVNDNIPHIGLTFYDNTKIDDEQIFVDGKQESSNDREADGYQVGTGSSTRYGYIGDGSEASSFNSGANNNYYEGEISEILYFRNKSFNSLEINKINTYLALKYGIDLRMDDDAGTLSTDERDYHASDNTVLWDYSANSGYNNKIAGIGRDDQTGLSISRAKSSQTASILEMEKAGGFSNDLDFIIWGSNELTGVSSGAPPDYDFITASIWKINTNGTPGTVDLSLDLEKAGFPVTSDPSVYALFIDSDDDFTSGASEYTTGASFSGNTITFTDVPLSDNDFIALAIADVNTPAGTGSLPELWYKADLKIDLTGSDVNQWTDNSPFSIDAIQSATGSMPVYTNDNQDNSFNFQPYLTFDGNNEWLAVDHSYSDDDFDQLYVFTVFRTGYSGTDYNDNWAFLDFDRSEFFDIYVRGDDGTLGFSYLTSGINDAQGSSIVNDDIPHIGLAFYDNTLTDDEQIYVDGRNELKNDRNASGVKLGTDANTRYGFIGDGSEADAFDGDRNNLYYDGDIAEIIYFKNNSLGSTEINKIQSYLSVKYGTTLDMADDPSTVGINESNYHASDNSVIWDRAANASYHNNILGIGRDDNSLLDKRKSKSAYDDAVLMLEKTTAFTSDLNYVVVGSNAQTGIDNGAPSGYQFISKQKWKVNVRGTSQTVNVSMDLNNAEFPVTDDPADYALLIDTDEDFTTGATEYTSGVTFSGNTITFIDVSLSDGNYIALVVANISTPAGMGSLPELWYKADSKIDLNVGNVNQWTDNSPYSIDASQGSSASMPAYTNDLLDESFNYQPYLTFDGNDDWLAVNHSYSDDDFGQVYVFTVFKTDYSGSGYNNSWAFLDFDRSEFFDAYVRGDDGTLGFSYLT